MISDSAGIKFFADHLPILKDDYHRLQSATSEQREIIGKQQRLLGNRINVLEDIQICPPFDPSTGLVQLEFVEMIGKLNVGEVIDLSDAQLVDINETEFIAYMKGATEPSSEATEPSSESTEPSCESTEPSIEVTEPSSESTEPSCESTEPSCESTEPSCESTEPSSESTEPSSEATEPSSESTEPSCESTEPSIEVTEPSSESTEPSCESTEPSCESTEPSCESTEPSSESTEPSSEATEPSSESTEPSCESTEPSIEVTEPSSESTEPSCESTEPSCESTEPSCESTEPSCESTEPSSESTEPSSEATEPSCESTEPSIEVTEPYHDWSANIPFVIGSGITNMKNSCYVSSILQMFFHLPHFAHWLLHGTQHSVLCNNQCSNSLSCPNSLWFHLRQMFNTVRANTVASPAGFLGHFRALTPMFPASVQQDANEFMLTLIELVGKENPDTEPFSSTFNVTLLHRKACLKCDHETQHEEDASSVVLPIHANDNDLSHMLANYFS
ncbi:cell wall protein IFF6-like [Bradysia coprophila]|uniref:cell wall protein IFF6-like n=1 Tax=Bradysia coprophila TaxID=38358 RepID=UPI00187DC7E6|nr:cell wall protein IFF6-like [Bradysia coprophila]